ncbi:MAG: DUF72 domain-containing protein [Candidatus Micrarchaeaceae archaeon]
MLHIGCCGLNFFSPKQLIGYDWQERYNSRLQAYASLFDTIEIDSTFYKLPKAETAANWLNEARSECQDFEFIPKAPQAITHTYKFSNGSEKLLKQFLNIAKSLDAEKLLFQTPASFAYSHENLAEVKKFFRKVPSNYTAIWEPRGTWLTEGENALVDLCESEGIILCTDPLRSKPNISQRFYYYRLHGFGKRMMYSYKFTDADLRRLKNEIKGIGNAYIMFNNTYMYEDAMRFKKMVK